MDVAVVGVRPRRRKRERHVLVRAGRRNVRRRTGWCVVEEDVVLQAPEGERHRAAGNDRHRSGRELLRRCGLHGCC